MEIELWSIWDLFFWIGGGNPYKLRGENGEDLKFYVVNTSYERHTLCTDWVHRLWYWITVSL